MPEATTTDIDIRDAIKHTMQALPDAKTDAGVGFSFWTQYTRNPILSPFGTRRREQDLRRIWRHDYNTAIRGAFTGIATEAAGKKYKITAPEKISKDAAKYYRATAKALNMPAVENAARPDIAYYDHILRYADFGRGWASFVQKFVLDYLRQDAGGFVEVIAPGSAAKAPKGAISGLATLDSLRCWPTGDPEYPVVYWNRKSEYHLIHNTRVIQFQDMPDSDEMTPGYGMCALSRSIAIAYREILMAQYLETQLDDKPPPGIIYASNMNEAVRDKMLTLYRKDQNSSDVSPEWGKLMWAFSLDAASPLKIDMLQFSTPPEKFDWKIYTEIDIDLLALAIGVDRQDLWQLSGSSGISGSKGQSETLSQKSRGKMKGLLYSEITRKINDILPDEYEFEFEERDSQQEAEEAANTQTWAGVATSLSSVLSPDQQLNLVANQSEQVRDVVTNEDGQILSIESGDIQTAQQIADDAAATHALTLATTPPPVDPNKAPAKPVNGGTGKPVPKRPGMGANVGRQSNGSSAQKAIQSTRLDFENDFADAVQAVQDNKMNRRRFGVVARALIKKYGRQAYTDGLEDGGISEPELSDDDYSTINSMTVEQSAYVTAFANTLFSGVEYTPEIRAEMWWNKSISPFYQSGVMSADKNGLYEWVLGDAEHCKDCLKMSGQVHRYRDYVKRGIMPQASMLECHGFNCACKLVKTVGKSSGRWL